jgi:uncharacterized DUF497 family protein
MYTALEISWSEAKNQQLKAMRGIGFEDVITAIETGHILDDFEHPQQDRPHQRLLVVEIHGYACVVPYVREQRQIFLKTVYHSRAMQKRYLEKQR